jgi:hypothetical protein
VCTFVVLRDGVAATRKVATPRTPHREGGEFHKGRSRPARPSDFPKDVPPIAAVDYKRIVAPQPGDMVAGRVLGADGLWHDIVSTQGANAAEGPHQGPARRRIFVLIAAISLIALVLVGDNLRANTEMNRLVDAVARSNYDIRKTRDAMYSAAKDTSALGNAPLRQAISDECATGAGNVQGAELALEDVGILPWHRALAKAKDRYNEYSKVWVRYLQACARTPESAADKAASAQMTATYSAAVRAIRAAEPALRDHSRVFDAVLGEPTGEDRP